MKDLIKNGSAFTSTGSCQLLFSADFKIRPIVCAVRSGYKPQRGTFQVAPATGDLLFVCAWRTRGADYSISRCNAVGQLQEVAPIEAAPIWAQLHTVHGWTKDWLEPASRGGYSIPTEVIPPAEYLAKKAKTAKLERFSARFGVQLPLDAAEISPKNGLNLLPRPSDEEFAAIVPQVRHWTGSMVGIDRWEEWYASNGEGESSPLTIVPSRDEGSNWAHSERPVCEAGECVVIPQGFKYVIRVIRGAYSRDHHSYGIAVDVREVI